MTFLQTKVSPKQSNNLLDKLLASSAQAQALREGENE